VYAAETRDQRSCSRRGRDIASSVPASGGITCTSMTAAHAFRILCSFSYDMQSEIGPTIIVEGVCVDKASAEFEFRNRGFVVKHFSPKGKTSNVALRMSDKLAARLAANNSFPVDSLTKFSASQHLTLANQAAAIVRNASVLGSKDCWIAQDDHQRQLGAPLSTSRIDDQNKSLRNLNEHYGSQIAMYYGFLTFYTNGLLAPMVCGLLLYFLQTWSREIDSAWLPVFCLGTTLWSTYFLETWKRRCSDLSYTWGVFGHEDKQLTVQLAKVPTPTA
jgi:hypothetical protein